MEEEVEDEEEEGGGNLFPTFHFQFSAPSTGTGVVSFINRLDSTTADRKTCSYAICHGTGAGVLLKLTERRRGSLFN